MPMFLFFFASPALASVSWCTSAAASEDSAAFHAQVAAAFAEWEAVAGCSDAWAVDAGDCATAGTVDATFLFGDPDDVLPDGVVATESSGSFVLNDSAVWETDAEILAGCADAFSVETLLRHDVGHAIGLLHSCSRGDCTDEEEASVMAPDMFGACVVREITSYDLGQVVLALGDGVAITSGEEDHFGAAPLEVCMAAVGPEGTAFTWDFGDGERGEGAAACHTYTNDIVTDIVLRYSADTCSGEIVSDASVFVCTSPHPYTELDPSLFRTTVSGLAVQVVNLADDSVAGCVEDVTWSATDDAGHIVDRSSGWDCTLDLPTSGTYTIAVTMTGPGGTSEESQEVTVAAGEPGGRGCSAVPGGAGLGALGAAFAGTIRRRRRAWQSRAGRVADRGGGGPP